MRFSLSWLKEFIELNETPQEIANILNQIGIEVDALESKSFSFEGVVVGKVLTAEPHPEADKLKVATVTDGSEDFQIVCGAPNCTEGLIVALAKEGARLEDDKGASFKIKKTKLRGVPSQGMLCSGKELAISNEDQGILELPKETPLGISLQSLYNDSIFEVALTPNLAHCFSVLGIARELGAYLRRSLKPLAFEQTQIKNLPDCPLSVTIEEKEAAPAFTASLIEGTTNFPAPQVIQERLEIAGMRSLNGIVDLTNYLMLSYGQPLHAFDADLLEGSLTIRFSSAGEKFDSLDGSKVTLPEGVLVIADKKGPAAIAGVMGGSRTAVSEKTKNVLLECAYFTPYATRRSIKLSGVYSEGSKRFERGVDPKLHQAFSIYAATQIKELSQGKSLSSSLYGESKDHNPEVTFPLAQIEKLLGTSFKEEDILANLKAAGCRAKIESNTLMVTAPSHRYDLKEAVDIIEELARLHGYHNLPKNRSYYRSASLAHSPQYLFERKVRKLLHGLNLQELLNLDLIAPRECFELFSLEGESSPKLENSSSDEHIHLRSSLLGGILKTLKHNRAFQLNDLQAFEIGRAYYKNNEGSYLEDTRLALVTSGNLRRSYWNESDKKWDFFSFKGLLEALFEKLHLDKVSFRSAINQAEFHGGQAAEAFYEDKKIAVLGKLHPALCDSSDIEANSFYAELRLDTIQSLISVAPATYLPLPNFPSSTRDWTLPLPVTTPVGPLLEKLQKLKHKLLEKVELVSVYKESDTAEEQKATFRITYRDPKKTLSQEAVERTHEWLIKQVS